MLLCSSFAFITYDDPESALYAIKRMDGVKLGRYRIKGKQLRVSCYLPLPQLQLT
jgi:RNA recognition motif-containing protein